MVDAAILKSLVEAELSRLNDARVMAHIRGLLVEPRIVMREFDYGSPRERFPCWSILDHDASNTGIAYCEHGFGPKSPWGLVCRSAVMLGGSRRSKMRISSLGRRPI